jgi:hypothetical protein
MPAGGRSVEKNRLTSKILVALFLVPVLGFTVLLLSSCSQLTGWRIPGTEKGAGATTTVYLVLENVEAVPEQVRTLGEIYVDDAFFGHTSRPAYYRYVGNKLVVGKVQVQKERIHTLSIRFPDYIPVDITRYFGMLPEYSVTFSLRRTIEQPAPAESAEGSVEECP